MEGADLSELNNEPGGHRIQRVPPTERKGRVHTSTVTVAVIDPSQVQPTRHEFNTRDFKIEWYSGTGAGGQNRNKVMASCRITHIPTGMVKTAQTRSRENSFRLARDEMLILLSEACEFSAKQNLNTTRISQIGTGMRGDKRRTYRFQDDMVCDDITGKRASVKRVLMGNFHLLW